MSDTISVSTTSEAVGSNGTVVIYADESGSMGSQAAAIWSRSGLNYDRLAAVTGFAGKPGHMIDCPVPPQGGHDRIIVLGRGTVSTASELAVWQDRGGSLVAKLEAADVETAAIVLDDREITPDMVAALGAGARLRGYRFDKYRAGKKRSSRMRLTLHHAEMRGVDSAIERAMAVVEGTLMARDLANEPPNRLGPSELAAAANTLSDIGVEVEILMPDEMEKLGMGALLAVGQGAARSPRLVVMHWCGGDKNVPPLALVGKGIVFDSGGLSIKPAASMDAMKGDMGGAAAVLGTMKALALRRAAVNVVGVVALAENMPDGNAYRPGDILTAMSGKTIEVINTDAEGRLVLADALWYTQDRFHPRAMIDLATLTGAMLVALAHDFAGLFTNSEDLADWLSEAGQLTGEKIWHLPMATAYEKLIESRFADIKNQGGRNGGSIIAAHFLAHFVNDVPWAHIDIAGTAFGVPASETNTSWATGFGVALLDRLIRDRYESRAQ